MVVLQLFFLGKEHYRFIDVFLIGLLGISSSLNVKNIIHNSLNKYSGILLLVDYLIGYALDAILALGLSVWFLLAVGLIFAVLVSKHNWLMEDSYSSLVAFLPYVLVFLVGIFTLLFPVLYYLN